GYRGLVADGVDAAIGSVVPERLGDLLGGVAVVEVDRLGTDVPGDVQAMADVVDDEHATGPAQQRGVGGHLPDGAGTVDGDGVTRLHARQLHAVIPGGEDVGQQGEVGLVLRAGRQGHAVVVGEGHPQVFGLAAGVGTHADVPVGPAGGAGLVDGQTEGALAAAAVGAESAGDVEGQHHAVALGQGGDTGADLLDHTHVLVAEGDAGLGISAPFVHVQVGPADGRGGDLDDHIGGVLDGGILDLLDGDLVGALVDDGSHDDPFHWAGRALSRPGLEGAGLWAARVLSGPGLEGPGRNGAGRCGGG